MIDEENTARLLSYSLLRAAQALFQKAPSDLDSVQLDKATRQAQREFEIENRVLLSKEATGVVISDKQLGLALQEIRDRYEDEASFLDDLAKNGLDEKVLSDALQRQCKVNAVLDRVAARAPDVSDVEVGIFYHSHLEKFHRPERREAYHILVSINPDFPENTREQAFARIDAIARRAAEKPSKFTRLAQRYSECPSALDGGRLGVVARGTLYPEIDDALFKLRAGEVSPVVETEIGFHVMFCKTIHRAETVSLNKASPGIRKMMKERYRRTCQRAWIATLPALP